MTDTRSAACRSCGARVVETVLDLGTQPVADDLFDDAGAARQAARHRLALGGCAQCGLVQLDASTPTLPNAVHGHGSAFSGTVLDHERAWAEELLQVNSLRDGGAVLDVGGEAGGLLRVLAEAGYVIRGGEQDTRLVTECRPTTTTRTRLPTTRRRSTWWWSTTTSVTPTPSTPRSLAVSVPWPAVERSPSSSTP
jgi:hypothetical protein